MSDSYKQSIINNGSSSSSGASLDFKHNGGPLYVSIQGTFDGAGVTIEASYDQGTTWGTATDIITSNTIVIAAAGGVDDTAYSGFLNVPVGLFRATGDTIGASTNITVTFSNVS